VFEHWAMNFAATLVWKAPAPLGGWTHVAVVYQEGTPTLFVNGRRVSTGLKSGNTVHAGVGVKSPQTPMLEPFQGERAKVMKQAEVLPEAVLAQLASVEPGAREEFPAKVCADVPGRFLLQTRAGGKYELTFSDGRKQIVDAPPVPEPVTVDGPWQLEFPSGWGAPEKVTLEKLISWPEHPDTGVRYFSGTATYRKSFDFKSAARSEGLGNSKCYVLDLGRVEVIAEVWLNGKALGTLWKPPFKLDVTEAIQSGSNTLMVKVTNLWPNRLIGDEQYPDDCTTNGTWTTRGIPAWPEWLQKGLPRPEPRRMTFTTFKHWKRDDALLASGLIGPVVIRAVEQIVIPMP
jgi:hypothetical protein